MVRRHWQHEERPCYSIAFEDLCTLHHVLLEYYVLPWRESLYFEAYCYVFSKPSTEVDSPFRTHCQCISHSVFYNQVFITDRSKHWFTHSNLPYNCVNIQNMRDTFGTKYPMDGFICERLQKDFLDNSSVTTYFGESVGIYT